MPLNKETETKTRPIPTITEEHTPESQCGFWAKRTPQTWEVPGDKQGLYARFINLTKVFDTVDRGVTQ